MGDPDLLVDARLLQAAHTSLVELKQEFSELDDRGRDLGRDWGSGRVQDAMDDFVGNWDDNRRRISTNLQSAADMTKTCLTRFDEVEQALCEGLSS